ncbi:unnamed protein product, partial [Protopolystoma xenopodis]
MGTRGNVVCWLTRLRSLSCPSSAHSVAGAFLPSGKMPQVCLSPTQPSADARLPGLYQATSTPHVDKRSVAHANSPSLPLPTLTHMTPNGSAEDASSLDLSAMPVCLGSLNLASPSAL